MQGAAVPVAAGEEAGGSEAGDGAVCANVVRAINHTIS